MANLAHPLWIAPCAVVMAFLLVSCSAQQQLYVDRFGSPTSTTCSETSPCTSLSSALKIATSNTVINVAEGAYSQSSNVGLTIATANLTIIGAVTGGVQFTCSSTDKFGWKIGKEAVNFTAESVSFSSCSPGIDASELYMLTLTSCQNAYGEAFLQVTSSQSVIITSYGGAHGSRIREPFPVISAESVAGVIIESSDFNSYQPHIELVNCSLTMSNTVLENCNYRSLTANDSVVTLESCIWRGNQNNPQTYTTIRGGSLYFGGEGTMVSAQSCEFQDNSISDPNDYAIEYGAALYLDKGVTGTFQNCSFQQNLGRPSLVDSSWGGLMGVMGASAAFKDCVFLENQLACTSRENCNSFNGGGAVFYCGGGADISLISCQVLNNTINTYSYANYGGGLAYCSGQCAIVASSSVLTGNSKPLTTANCDYS